MTTQPLFPHQYEGARRLSTRTPTYLGFDMGIGKTRTFIEAVRQRNVPRAPRNLSGLGAAGVEARNRALASAAAFVIVRTPADFTRSAHYYIISHGLMSQKNGPVAEALINIPVGFYMTALMKRMLSMPLTAIVSKCCVVPRPIFVLAISSL